MTSRAKARRSNSSRLRPRRQMLALEPRLLFDGAGAATADAAREPQPQPPAADQAEKAGIHNPAPAGSEAAPPPAAISVPLADTPRRELMVVDTRIPEWRSLVAQARPNVQVLLLDAGADPLTQITAAIGDQPVDAIHLLAHGDPGSVRLGGLELDRHAVDRNAEALAQLGSRLTANGDILLYGCSTGAGEGGRLLVEALARVTGADVAASANLTGAAALGGDWVLETRAGLIEATAFGSAETLAGYARLLALPVLDLNGAANFVVSDSFDTATYTGGTGAWLGGWTEFDASPSRFVAGSGNSDNNPLTGNVLHGSVASLGVGNQIVLVGHGQQFNDSIQRSVNLLPYTSATLTFDWRLVNVEQTADVVAVQISTNGGASFATIASYSRTATGTGTTSGSASLDLSSYLATNTSENAVIRFAVTGGFGETDDRFYLDNVVLTASGNNYSATFTEGAAAVAVAGPATVITDADGHQIASATVTLNNAQAGDLLSWGALPSGISASISGNTVTLTGVSTYASYTAALQAVTFSNSLDAPNKAAVRNLSLRVTDTNGEQSAAATTYIRVVATDDPMNAAADTFSTLQNTAVSGNVLANNGAGPDTDPDGVLRVSTTLVTNAATGTVTIAADGSFTYTPNAGFTGTDTFQYQLISDAQVPGVNYQYWNVAPGGNSLATGFPGTAPTATGIAANFDVDAIALANGNTTLSNFTIRFSTSIDIASGGSYQFWTGSDDGSLLRVINSAGTTTLVVNNDGAHSWAEQTGTITLSPGRYTIQVDFFEVGGQEDLAVFYSGADTSGVRTNLGAVAGITVPTTATGTVTVNVRANVAARNDTGTTSEDTGLTVSAPGVLSNDQNALATLTTGAWLNYDAATDTGGNNAWTDDTGRPGMDWAFSANATPITPTTAFSGITRAYTFPISGNGAAVASFDSSGAPGTEDQLDATWEIWFKPANLTGQRVLFESGGTTDGVAIFLRNADADGLFDDLTFAIRNGGPSAYVTADLSAILGSASAITSEFVQVVAVYDKDATGNTDVLRLYVNGAAVGTTTTSGNQNNLNDWTDGDGAGLGRVNSQIVATNITGLDATVGNYGAFQGDIALFRFYNNSALTAAQARDNFIVVSGGDSLSVTAVNGNVANVGTAITLASGALVTLNANGSFTYNPNGQFEYLAAGQTALDSFTYTTTDRQGNSDTATVSITVTGVNDAPVIDLDLSGPGTGFTTTYVENAAGVPIVDTDVTITDVDGTQLNQAVVTLTNVQANDLLEVNTASLPPGIGATISGNTVTLAGVGTLAQYQTALRAVTFRNSSENPSTVQRSISVTVRDTAGGVSAAATTLVNVTAVNDAPTLATPASASYLDTAGNDTFAANSGTLLGTDPDSATLTYGISGGTVAAGSSTLVGAYGTLVVNTSTGAYTYTPNATAINALTGAAADTFTVTVNDGAGGNATAAYTVNITGANDTPTLATPTAASYTDTAGNDTFTNATGTLAASDRDTGQTFTYGITGGTVAAGSSTLVGAYGTLVVNTSTGAYTYTPNATAINALTGAATDSFTVTVNDGAGGNATAAYTVNITGANDTPSLATPTAASYTDTAGNDTFTNATGTLAASDRDTGQTFTYGITGGTVAAGSSTLVGAYGTLVVNTSTGAYTYTPNATAINALTGAATDSFTVTVNDGAGGNATAAYTVNITGANDTPTDLALSNSTVAENAAGAMIGNVTVTDPDAGDTHTYSVSDPRFEVVGGQLKLKTGQSLDFETEPTVSLIIAATDQGGLTYNETFTLTVTNRDEAAPTFSSGSSASVNENVAAGALVYTAVASDPAADGGPSDPISYTLSGTDAAAFSINATTGAVTLNASPDFETQNAYSFNVTATDAAGNSATHAVALTINNVNESPTPHSDLATTPINVPVTIGVLANDTDVDGDPLTVISASSADGSVVINSGATLTFTPATNFSGTSTITYTVSDPGGLVGTAQVAVNVGTNTPPSGSDATIALNEDGTYAVQVADLGFSDPDAGQSLANVRIDSLPGAGTLTLNGAPVTAGTLVSAADLAANRLVFAPAANTNGAGCADFAFTVQDSAGAFASAPSVLTFDVAALNDAPTAANVAVGATEDVPVAGTLPAALDAEGDPVTYAKAGDPAHGTVVVNANGTYTYTPAANYNGTDSFTYSVSDGKGGSNTYTVTVSVAAVNDPAVISGTASGTAREDVTTIASGALTVNDADAGESVFVAQSGAAGTYGTFSINAAGTWSYVLNNAAANVQALNSGDSVTDAFTVASADGTTQVVVVTVQGSDDALPPTPNRPPIVADRDVPATEDVSATLAPGVLLTGASDPDGDALSVVAVSNAVNGTVVLNADGSVTFTPAPNYNGRASFTYTVSDGRGGRAVATVNLDVGPANDAPTAADASASTAEDEPLSGRLPAAQDADGDVVTYAKARDAAHGTVRVDADGSYVYVPNPDFNGRDSFAYAVADGKGGVNVHTVTVTVLPENDVPVVGGTSHGTATAGDARPVTGALTIDDPDVGESAFRPAMGSGSYGRYTIDAAGNWTYAVDGRNPIVLALASGTTLTDGFDVVTADGTMQRVTVLITASGTEARRDAGLPPDFPVTPGPFFRAAPPSAYAPLSVLLAPATAAFGETDFVLRAVAESQALRAEQAATLAGTASLDDLARVREDALEARVRSGHALFVLPAVERIQAELLELRARFPSSGNRFAVGAESLCDDLGPFSAFAPRQPPLVATAGLDADRTTASDASTELRAGVSPSGGSDAEDFTLRDASVVPAGKVTVGAPSFTALLREAASRIRPLSLPGQSDRAR